VVVAGQLRLVEQVDQVGLADLEVTALLAAVVQETARYHTQLRESLEVYILERTVLMALQPVL
jgi:hypothetical protein